MTIQAIIAGNIGGDAEMRKAGDSDVCSFSVAAETDERDRKTEWFDVSVFGAYGEALCKHLKKGGKVTVFGDLTFRENEGKRYNKLRAHRVALQGESRGGRDDDDRDDRKDERRDSRDDRGRDDRRDRDNGRRDERGGDRRGLPY